MKVSIDKIIESLICYLGIFIPLYVIGFRFFGYDFSFAMVILIVLNIFLIFKNRFNKYVLGSFILFLIWCFFTAFPRAEINTYIPSLAALLLVCFPLSASWRYLNINKKRVYKYYIYGIYLTLGIVGYELLCIFLGIEPFYNNISFGIFERIRVGQFLGINRVKGFFLEPAHLAIYIVFSYVIVDMYDENVKRKEILRLILFGTLLLTFSLTGLIIILIYYFAKNIVFNSNRFRNTIKIGLTLGLVLTILGFFYSEYLFFIFNRFGSMFEALQKGGFSRTYGARANAIFILSDYYESEGFIKFLFGEGYANYESWLKQNFGHLGLSSLAAGKIPNVFSVLVLSTGLIGLLFYFAFLVTIVKQFKVENSSTIFVLIIVLNFGIGFLISYMMWALILTLLLLNQK